MKSIATLLLASTLFISFAHANTVRIGDGGETQTGTLASEAQLISALGNIKTDAQLLLNSWLANENIKILTPAQKIELVNVIRTTPLEILTKDACHDGIDRKDAVAYSSPKKRICVSIQQLRSKLNTDNYRIQTLALMIHEYSHLIGFDERQAENLQQLTLQYIGILGYPVALMGGDVDDFTLLDPYSIFAEAWTNKDRLAGEVKIYITELRYKIEQYAPYSQGNYPALPKTMDYAPDILIRLNYLEQASKAYWQKYPSKEIRKKLEELTGGTQYRELDLIFFNNMSVNPSFQNFIRQDLPVPVLDRQTPESDFRNLILQIDLLKRTMEQQILSVLKPR
ncbi:hypothetical protein ACLVWU_10825 [Bdellovibrio sp. HCB290]|uniref:hypothetical protein n=1 Tax=Bdellovibrio sp. HCB290 TaxID=3394356 RepID=UPI0039B4B9B9